MLLLLACQSGVSDSADSPAPPDPTEQVSSAWVTVQVDDSGALTATCAWAPDVDARVLWTRNGSPGPDTVTLTGLGCGDTVGCSVTPPGGDPVFSESVALADAVDRVLELQVVGAGVVCQQACGVDQAPGRVSWTGEGVVGTGQGPVLWPQARADGPVTCALDQASVTGAVTGADRLDPVLLAPKDIRRLGQRVALADVDGDGGVDVLLGAPHAGEPRPRAGGVDVAWSWDLGQTDTLTPTPALRGEASNDLAGWSVRVIGDRVLLGVAGDEHRAYLGGAVALIPMDQVGAQVVHTGEMTAWYGTEIRGWAGSDVAVATAADGSEWALVGAYGWLENSGAVFELPLDGAVGGDLDTPSAQGTAAGGAFGLAVSGWGDADADGVPEWAVGAPLEGQIYRLDHGALTPLDPPAELDHRVGWSLASLDWDGDGVLDLAAANPDGTTLLYTGGVWLTWDLPSVRVLGADVWPQVPGDELLVGVGAADQVWILGSDGTQVVVQGPADTGFGWDLAVGDVDAEGTLDVVVSTPFADNEAGAAWVVAGPLTADRTL